MLGDLKHENLSSILGGTDAEMFSIDDDAPPTFREQKERTGNFFLTEKITAERREDTQNLALFQFRDEVLNTDSDELLY